MSHEHHFTSTSSAVSDETAPGALIAIRLPDKFHPESDHEDPRSARYDLSAQGLTADFTNQLAIFFDKYLDREGPHTMEIVDYLWHYASQASQGDTETPAIDSETILENCRTLLELACSESSAQNATIAEDARN